MPDGSTALVLGWVLLLASATLALRRSVLRPAPALTIAASRDAWQRVPPAGRAALVRGTHLAEALPPLERGDPAESAGAPGGGLAPAGAATAASAPAVPPLAAPDAPASLGRDARQLRAGGKDLLVSPRAPQRSSLWGRLRNLIGTPGGTSVEKAQDAFVRGLITEPTPPAAETAGAGHEALADDDSSEGSAGPFLTGRYALSPLADERTDARPAEALEADDAAARELVSDDTAGSAPSLRGHRPAVGHDPMNELRMVRGLGRTLERQLETAREEHARLRLSVEAERDALRSLSAELGEKAARLEVALEATDRERREALSLDGAGAAGAVASEEAASLRAGLDEAVAEGGRLREELLRGEAEAAGARSALDLERGRRERAEEEREALHRELGEARSAARAELDAERGLRARSIADREAVSEELLRVRAVLAADLEAERKRRAAADTEREETHVTLSRTRTSLNAEIEEERARRIEAETERDQLHAELERTRVAHADASGALAGAEEERKLALDEHAAARAREADQRETLQDKVLRREQALQWARAEAERLAAAVERLTFEKSELASGEEAIRHEHRRLAEVARVATARALELERKDQDLERRAAELAGELDRERAITAELGAVVGQAHALRSEVDREQAAARDLRVELEREQAGSRDLRALLAAEAEVREDLERTAHDLLEQLEEGTTIGGLLGAELERARRDLDEKERRIVALERERARLANLAPVLEQPAPRGTGPGDGRGKR